MADLNSAYEQELKKRLGSGLATPYSGARTKGGEIFEGIASGVQGLGELVQSTGLQYPKPLERLAMQIDGYLRKPSSGLSEQIEIDKDIASGIGRPREIQEQIDIFESVPGADPLTVEQINQLSRNQSEGRKSKPFPTEQAARVKSGGRGKVNEQLGERENYQRAIDGPTPEEMALMEQAREQGQGADLPDADPTEQLFSQAMSEYISQARTGAEDDLPEIGDIEAYKKKFAEATGIDISGKPDTSQALMAMGLSMMQNRAGKNFNVGKALDAVGKAGEKAMPALTAAKAEARNNVIAAGKYALTAQDADEKTRKAAEKDLMNRGKYWVFSKGGKDGEFSNFEKGEFVDLNKAEMNKLITDPKFDEKYSFVDATTRFDILAKRAEGQELGDMWGKKPEAVSLIGGAAKDVPAELQVFGTYANPNYSGKSTSRIKLSEEPQAVINRFLSYQDGIDRSVSKFTNLVDQIDQGVSIPGQAVDKVTGVFRSLGFNVEGLPSNTAEAKRILNNIAIDEATNILKESGKTLSDGDRRLVRERVGQIDFFNADKALIKKQVQEVYDLIVTKSQKNLDTAIGKLESDFGISVRPTTKSGPKDQAEVDEFNKMYGTEFTMETFPKD